MEQNYIQTVVQGEASESDDDEVTVLTNRIEENDKPGGIVIVPGEDSESDEEEDTVAPLPPLKVNQESRGDESDVTSSNNQSASPRTGKRNEADQLKYQTLLHRKLFEKNANLRKHLIDTITFPYKDACRDLQNTTQSLTKTQLSIQEVSQNLRLVTNNLFHLEDRIDIITTCNLLPNLNIEVQDVGKQEAAPVTS